jgi:DNA-binding transcriptional regulator YiaG
MNLIAKEYEHEKASQDTTPKLSIRIARVARNVGWRCDDRSGRQRQGDHARDREALLTPILPLKGAQIRALRKREHVSQSVFVAHLNVSKGLVSQWERDEKHPAGPSLKLLALVAKHGLAAIA